MSAAPRFLTHSVPRFLSDSAPRFLSNSVAARELRTRMRGWRSIVVLVAYMAVLGLIAIGFLIQQAGPSTNQSSQVGLQLFQVLAIFQLFLIMFITPASTAGAISGERQRQTWDLLLVTRLSTFDIVWGKLVAGLAFNLLLIFGSLPLFSLVFLFGGVAPEDLLHVYIVFLVTVILLGMISLFISALTPRLASAMILSNVVALLLGIGVSLLSLYLENWGQQNYITSNNGPPQQVPAPPLTPLAHLDPFAALASALPTTDGTSFLGGLGKIHLPLLHGTIPLWGWFSIVSLTLSVGLFLITTGLARHAPPWLRKEG